MADLETPVLALPYANPADPLGGAAASMGALALGAEEAFLGVVGTVAERTTDSSATSGSEVSGHTVTVPVVSGAKYWVCFFGDLASTVAGDQHFVRIREDSLSGTVLGLRRYRANSTDNFPYFHRELFTAAATLASKTFVFSLARESGTGLGRVEAAATTRAYMWVVYIGGA